MSPNMRGLLDLSHCELSNESQYEGSIGFVSLRAFK